MACKGWNGYKTSETGGYKQRCLLDLSWRTYLLVPLKTTETGFPDAVFEGEGVELGKDEDGLEEKVVLV